MRDILIQDNEWEVSYTTHCGDYYCGNCSPGIEIRRGHSVHRHWHVKRFLRREVPIMVLLARAMEYISTATDREVQERETFLEAKEQARTLLEIQQTVRAL